MSDCYSCKHRGEVPGSAHSTCNHPDLPEYDPLSKIFVMLGRGSAIDKKSIDNFGIELNPIGIRGGWANWPLNFDPVWISNCNRYEKKL